MVERGVTATGFDAWLSDEAAVVDALRHAAAARRARGHAHMAHSRPCPTATRSTDSCSHAMNLPFAPTPDFRSGSFLRAHIADTMAFYHPRAIDPAGGFFHYFRDDGSVYDASHRHLVSSTRFVFNHAMAAREFGNAEYLDAARHGLRYLRDVHRDARSGGYAWTIRDGAAGRPDQPLLRRGVRAAGLFHRA